MKKRSISFFVLSLVFLCIAIVYFTQSELSVAKFLIFFFNGVACGAFLANGVASLRKTN
jgi:hypothetical protein